MSDTAEDIRQEPAPGELPERAPSFLARNRRTFVVLGIAAAIVAVIIALTSAKSADKPSVNQASADVASLSPAPAYDPGEFGHADSLTLDTVDFVEVVRDTHTCTATGELLYSGDAVSARQRVAVHYVRANNGGWMIDGTAEVTKLTWSTSAGVDPSRVLAQADMLLQQADAQELNASGAANDPGEPTLYTLYRGTACTIASEEFDARTLTDTLVLHFDDEGTFVSHNCDLTVALCFDTETGQWELVSCSADEHARDDDYSAIVGTWEGTFTSQDNDGHSCYAPRTTQLALQVDAVSLGTDGTLTIAGSLSALVHRHGSITADADATPGDELVEGETFTGVMERSDQGYVCRCTTSEGASGTVLLQIKLGTEESPSAASVTVSTTGEHDEGTLFVLNIPYQAQSTFVDHYQLAKVPEE